jgi:hypothetical protein
LGFDDKKNDLWQKGGFCCGFYIFGVFGDGEIVV